MKEPYAYPKSSWTEIPSKETPTPFPIAALKTASATPPKAEDIPDYQILGEAYNCYVIVQLSDRLLMIDKHAAHERIIFEDLKKLFL